MNIKNRSNYRAVFVGSGPAGTGPVLCALQQGKLDALLNEGIAMLDSSDRMCRGSLGQYIINSDTLSDTFLECLREQERGVLAQAYHAPSTRALNAYAGGPVPLALAGEFLNDLGSALQTVFDAHPISQFFPRTTAKIVRKLPNGNYAVVSDHVNEAGEREEITLETACVVFATGGLQNRQRMLAERIAHTIPLSPEYDEKVVLSNVALTQAGVEEIRRHLLSSPHRKVVIIGGSHSATSAAWTLLNKSGLEFGEGDIKILHREKLKLFYASKDAAHAEGYTDFDDRDICPLTGRVYRLAGFRFDSRELILRVWGIGNREPEKRMQLVRLAEDGSDAGAVRRLLDEAAVIITAFGYRPASIPVLDEAGNEVRLCANNAGAPPLVDRQCRVLDEAGLPLPNLYGIGLASGFVPSGDLGGEPSFRGQTNGLWLYQNGVGEIVLQALMENTRPVS